MIAGGSYADAVGTAALTANTWSYLTETYDGSTLRLYVNGTQVASTAHTGTIATSTNPLQIGGDSIYGQYFAGLIDKVRVYNVALDRRPDPDRQATRWHARNDPAVAAGDADRDRGLSASEVDLSWGASTDKCVTGYLIERCSGASCTNFAQIAAPAGTGTTLQGHQRQRLHQLQLPRPRHRRRRQPQHLLERRYDDDDDDRPSHQTGLRPGSLQHRCRCRHHPGRDGGGRGR